MFNEEIYSQFSLLFCCLFFPCFFAICWIISLEPYTSFLIFLHLLITLLCIRAFNLNSIFSQYVALGAMLSENGDELELFCSLPEDEVYFYKFFHEHPEVI